MPTSVCDGVFDITCERRDSGNRYRVFLGTVGTPTLFDTGFPETTDEAFAG